MRGQSPQRNATIDTTGRIFPQQQFTVPQQEGAFIDGQGRTSSFYLRRQSGMQASDQFIAQPIVGQQIVGGQLIGSQIVQQQQGQGGLIQTYGVNALGQQVIREVVQETKMVPVIENRYVDKVVQLPTQQLQTVQLIAQPVQQVQIPQERIVYVQNTVEIERLTTLLRQYEIRIQQLNSEIVILKDRKPEVIQIRDESQISILQQEIQRLQAQLRSKSEDVEKLKRAQRSLEEENDRLRQWQTKYSQLEYDFQELQRRYRDLDNQTKAQIEEWRKKYMTLETTVTTYRNYENQIRALQQRVSELEQEVEQSNQQVIMWRTKYSEISSLTSKVNDLITTLFLAQVEINGLRLRIKELEASRQSVRQSASTFQVSTQPQQVTQTTVTKQYVTEGYSSGGTKYI